MGTMFTIPVFNHGSDYKLMVKFERGFLSKNMFLANTFFQRHLETRFLNQKINNKRRMKNNKHILLSPLWRK